MIIQMQFHVETMRNIMLNLMRTLMVSLLLTAGSAGAAMTIEIVGAGANQIPVAIVPFRAEDGLAQKLTPVVAADLARSGLFRMVDPGGMNPVPYEPEQLNYGQWKARGAEAVVIGSVNKAADGRYDIRFRVMDAVKQTQIAGYVYFATEGQLRLTAHKIADVIYEKLTGDTGVFATRITYVVKRGKNYELHVADADGYGAQSVLSSNEPIISPAWSPDGTRLAYVSFEQKKPVVYVQSLVTGARQPVAQFRGSNSAPAWSPDGKQLAVTLTRDGGSQLFLINADGSGAPQRLTPHRPAISHFGQRREWLSRRRQPSGRRPTTLGSAVCLASAASRLCRRGGRRTSSGVYENAAETRQSGAASSSWNHVRIKPASSCVSQRTSRALRGGRSPAGMR